MANTFSASLLIDTLSEQVITTLGNRLAPLRAFSSDYSTDPLRQGANVQVPKATAGSTTLTNASNFETGNTTVSNVNVLVSHYSQPFHITSAELNGGKRLENLVKINAQTFANKIIDVALAPFTTTNFTNLTVAEASFVAANAKTLWASVAKSPMRHLILNGTAFANLLPTSGENFGLAGSTSYRPGAYGYDGIILNTRFDGAATNCYGVACGPEAVATAAGIPDMHAAVAQQMLEQSVVTLEDLGLSVQLNIWGSAPTRAVWASMDVMFGAALGDNTAGKIILSA